MIKKSLILIIALMLFSCQSLQRGGELEGLSPKLQKLVTEAVFEVLVKKPEEKSVVYDKEPDWTLIPFAIRNDDYYSIGTAFAISATEAVSAFHVIDLSSKSDIYTEYFIRDSNGNVYEIDQIHKAHKEKDFLVFTVKNRTFTSWFDLEPRFRVNSQVFSIGNALGEGIVVRNGLVLGTVPENESGRWEQLKSSANGNPGNSGGPLVTPDGKVVGIVASLRDNILYSLPVSELISAPPNIANYRYRASYGHLLLNNRRLSDTYELNVTLPANYKEVRDKIFNSYKEYYPNPMTRLFEEAPAYLNGPNNRFLFSQAVRRDFPEFAYLDRNDDQWKISDIRVSTYELPDDGSLLQAEFSGVQFIKIRRPKSINVEKINTDPKTIMDTYLSGINLERGLSNTGRYRMLSFGEPVQVSEYKDKQGRTWIKTWWLLNFADSIVLTYILPTPNGPAIVMARQNSTSRHVYEWDLEATCDRIFVGYRGDMEEWRSFLSMRKWVPDFLGSLSLNWNEANRTVSISMPQFRINANDQIFNWNPQSILFLAPSYYMKNNAMEFGIRTAILYRDLRGTEYFLVRQHIKPDERLGTRVVEQWNDVLNGRFPYDGQPRISPGDNTGSIEGLLNQPASLIDVRHTLYLHMENPGDEESLARRYRAAEQGITIIR
ncbi:MAG: serine protease [Treponema sp.]|jgi:hypothetical protein|nr:serine protease [Treponema sp.]